jgi:hypothetical protein
LACKMAALVSIVKLRAPNPSCRAGPVEGELPRPPITAWEGLLTEIGSGPKITLRFGVLGAHYDAALGMGEFETSDVAEVKRRCSWV